MSDAAREILVAGGQALARGDGLAPSLQILLDSIAGPLDIASAAIVIVGRPSGQLRIVASFGLGDGAVAGLAAAIDVPPTVPGGPALRSHLPLLITRHGADTVLGVLALAHDRPIDPAARPLLQAGADLAAVAIERYR